MRKGAFYGTIRECFYDYVEKHPALPFLQLVADFCGIGLDKVQTWQRRAFFPGGLQEAQLGTILELLEYQVEELNRLSANERQVVRLIGFRLETPEFVREKLKYQKVQSLWAYLLNNEGGSAAVRGRIEELLSEGRLKRIRAARRQWLESIRELKLADEAKSDVPPPLVFQVEMATAFARSVATTTVLARILVDANERGMALRATSGGGSIHELMGLLKDLTASESD